MRRGELRVDAGEEAALGLLEWRVPRAKRLLRFWTFVKSSASETSESERGLREESVVLTKRERRLRGRLVPEREGTAETLEVGKGGGELSFSVTEVADASGSLWVEKALLSFCMTREKKRGGGEGGVCLGGKEGGKGRKGERRRGLKGQIGKRF